ncbi:MAG TPA: YdcF family protein [Pyrinomonadaceae bacterium]|nr:YdcF family protein [Pyrinomonadaceae bacterium]
MSFRKRKIFGLLIGAGSLLALWPIFAWGAARFLVVRTAPQTADAIVMLSGSATFRERAEHAAQLYREGRGSRIVLTNDNLKSGWSEQEQRNPLYYERARQRLIDLGVPEEKIEVIKDPILGTYDEAVTVRLYCENQGIHSVVVVTSGYHSRRALWTFRHVFQGSDVAVGMDPAATGIDTPGPAIWWLKSFGWEMVPEEYGKLICYRLNLK